MNPVFYGFRVSWRPTRDDYRTVTTSYCASPEIAERQAWEAARAGGYRPPKWWEWWRWGEQREGS